MYSMQKTIAAFRMLPPGSQRLVLTALEEDRDKARADWKREQLHDDRRAAEALGFVAATLGGSGIGA